jgi:SAM-dependent methyltransferase
MKPFVETAWVRAETVEGFKTSLPNQTLMRFMESERNRRASARVLDIGCGAGRNAGPIAALGFDVVGIDLSWPMLRGAAARDRAEGKRIALALAPMERIPVRGDSFDVVIAHGIWNLARSDREFRRAVREAARVAKAGAALFVFTFSRNTLPVTAKPVEGETFTFTQFSGEPQCFLTAEQLLTELSLAGFVPDPEVPLTELNRPRPGHLQAGGPVIYEGVFRRISKPSGSGASGPADK